MPMTRTQRTIFLLIALVAVATFLFGLWQFVGGR